MAAKAARAARTSDARIVKTEGLSDGCSCRSLERSARETQPTTEPLCVETCLVSRMGLGICDHYHRSCDIERASEARSGQCLQRGFLDLTTRRRSRSRGLPISYLSGGVTSALVRADSSWAPLRPVRFVSTCLRHSECDRFSHRDRPVAFPGL